VAARIRTRTGFAQILLALSLSLLQGCPQLGLPCLADQSQVISLNNDGVKALNAGNYQLAIQKFEEALKSDPNYTLARDNLAIAHNNYGLQLRNNPKEALKQFHKALYLNRSNPTTLQNVEGIIRMLGKNPRSFADRVELGDQARLSGDFIGAIIEYEAACQIKDDPKIHVKLGDVYRVRGEDDKAIKEYVAASKLGDSAEVELKLGQAYGAAGDIPNAISSYGRAIGYKSDDPDVLDGLVSGWNAALAKEPLAPENHIGLGQAYQYRGDFGQAEAEYRMALKFSPGHRNPVAERLLAALPAAKVAAEETKHINAGVDLQGRKLYDQAIEEYKKALQNDPNNASIWVNIGTAYQAKEDYQNALKAYQQALAIDHNNQAAQQGIKTASEQQQNKTVGDDWKAGGDLFKQGKFQEAAEKYQAVLKVTPQDAASHFSLGAVYQAMKRIDDAIAEYRLAIQYDQKNQSYQKAYQDAMDLKAGPIIDAAVAKHKAKDYAGAIDLYQQALLIRPQNAELYFDMAGAEYSRQNYVAARNDYQKALEIDPKGQINAMYFLGVIDENSGKGLDAKTEYQKYLLQGGASSTYAGPARERIDALTKNIADTQKIKTEAEQQALKDSDDAFQQAVKLQQGSQFDAAIVLYQKAIQIQPKNADFVYSLGTCYQQKGDIDNALAQYRLAITMVPNNKDFQKALSEAMELKGAPLIDQGVDKQTKGDLAGAIESYNQALQYMPNNARLYTNLGTALQQSDKFAEARNAYQKGYDLDKKGEVGNLYLMGAIDENYNQGGKALSEYQQYLMQAGAKGTYYANAKDASARLSKNVLDVAKLQTSGDIQNDRAASDAYDAGVKLQQATKYDEAIESYQKAVQIKPKEPAYLYAIGTAYQAKGDMAKAIEFYQKASDIDPKNKQYKDILNQAVVASAAPLMDEAVKKQTSGDVPGAITLYEQALKIMPNNARGWTNLGSAYQQAENWKMARSSYEKALQIDPKGEVLNWYFIGVLDENDGQAPAAIQDYQRYVQNAGARGEYAAQAQSRISDLKAHPVNVQKIQTAADTKKNTDAQAAYDAAVAAQQANKLDEAIEDYNKAIQITPDPAYYYARGTAYQAKNDLDKALEDYRTAQSKNPKEPAYTAVIKQVNQIKAGPLVNSAIDKQTTKNDPAGAIVDYLAALKIDDDAGVRMNYGTALQQTGKTQEAINEYKRAIQMDPKATVDAHYYLGTAYEQIKKPLDAVREYKEYLRLAPTGTNAKDAHDRIKILEPHK